MEVHGSHYSFFAEEFGGCVSSSYCYSHNAFCCRYPYSPFRSILRWVETTAAAGYTSEQGHKVGVAHPQLSPRIIVYDGDVAAYTPLRLWLSSGIRAVDHAIETLYNPRAAETPHRLLSLAACHELFNLLPQSKAEPDNTDIRQHLQIVAFGTLFSMPYGGALGLSHSMGKISLRDPG